MSYLDNVAITVDAILTDKGRELLSRGDGSFAITQFALADDEIDYKLYNPNNPSGSAFYGEVLTNQPLLQAFANSNVVMKYKLVTLPRGTATIPVINIGYTQILLKQGASLSVTPQTLNYLGAVSTYEPSGYICSIGDGRLVSNFTGTGINTNQTITQSFAGSNLTVTQIGTTFSITATTINTLFGSTNTQISTIITFIGNDSGARISLPLIVTKQTS